MKGNPWVFQITPISTVSVCKQFSCACKIISSEQNIKRCAQVSKLRTQNFKLCAQINKSCDQTWYMSSLVWFMVFNATFNNVSVISWRSVLLVEETGVPGEFGIKWVPQYITIHLWWKYNFMSIANFRCSILIGNLLIYTCRSSVNFSIWHPL
jgi:hypothetical protein